MRRLRGLWAAVAAGTLAGAGCVTCPSPICQKVAVDAGPDCPVPLAGRSRVYVFMVDGVVPPWSTGVTALRDGLAAHGFMKVGIAGPLSASLLGKEMRQAHLDDPAARFVVIGYDHGSAGAVKLAADCGVPVEAIILLDPPGKVIARSGPRTLVIRSGPKPPPSKAETLLVPAATHFTLPGCPETVDAVAAVLSEVAQTIWSEQPTAVPINGWEYEHAPPAYDERRESAKPAGPWNFLSERSLGRSPTNPPAESASEETVAAK